MIVILTQTLTGVPRLTLLELHKNCITSLPDNFFQLCPALTKVRVRV